MRATLFVTGTELERYPELGVQIVAGGHELGNHSDSHKHVAAGADEDVIRGAIAPIS